MTSQNPPTPFDRLLLSKALPHPLRPYQEAGLEFLIGRDSILLGDEMGLGKTVQVVVAIRMLFQEKRITRALIVVPRVLRGNWLNEFNLWAPDLSVRQVIGTKNDRKVLYSLPFPVIIATYGQIRADANDLNKCNDFGVVVLDEAHTIKNTASQTNFACRRIPRRKAWALTGTPIENSTDDLVSIFSFLQPHLLSKEIPPGEIRPLIQEHFLRRTKDEALPDLPPIIEQELELDLYGSQRETYEHLWQHRNDALTDYTDRGQLFALITKLKQLCNHEPDTNMSVKSETLELLLENLTQPSDKIIVFSQYVKTLESLSVSLPCSNRIFHGQQNDQEHESTLEWFRNTPGPSVLLMSLKAGGVGLNLQEASLVVLFDRWWNPAVESQAVERAHRFGRDRPLHVVKFLVKNTIEDRIIEILHRKKALTREVIGKTETATVSTNVETLNRDTLRIILGLSSK